MNRKTLNKIVEFRLFFLACVVVVIIFFLLRPVNTMPLQKEEPGKPRKASVYTTSLIPVREDSLNNLFRTFFEKKNISGSSFIRSEQGTYHVKIGRFGNNPREFYNNDDILKDTDNGFKIEIQQNGEIEAKFKRIQIAGTSYVEVPTDVLFRLFQIRN